MGILNRLFNRRPKPEPATFDAPLAPDGAFFAVGDVHGCFEQMTTLLGKMQESDPDLPVVFVGDYVDRGERSAEVLRKLGELQAEPAARVHCLAGNHEEMMLNFLDDPERSGERWLRYGGLQTLASFEVAPAKGADGMRQTRDRLVDAMGDQMISWMRALPTIWQSGNVAVIHAAADPFSPMNVQSRQHLLWGHPEYESVPRADGVWTVHGHTIVDAPGAKDGRISIDTGAFATGRLTAARVSAEGVTFLST